MPSILTRSFLSPASKSAKEVTLILSRLQFQPVLLKWLLPPLLAAAGLKVWLVAAGLIPFNADEAVVALMARHILQGARPVFFYGQAYMGSLDAWLVAGGFTLFGQEVWVIRLVQGLLYLLTLVTTAWLGKTALGSWRVGVLAVWFLAVPSVNVTLYTTASLGGYGEALLIGNLILLVGLRIVEDLKACEPCVGAHGHAPLRHSNHNRTGPLLLTWGFLVGLGLWAFGLTLVYALPMGAVLGCSLLRHHRSPKLLVTAALGMLLGSAPWWGYALENGFGPLIAELQGGNIAGVEGLPWFSMVSRHLLSLLLLGSSVIFGLRPPWEVRWLGLPLLPFVLIFWVGTIGHVVRLAISEKRSAVSRQRTAISDRRSAIVHRPSPLVSRLLSVVFRLSSFVPRPSSPGRAVLTGLMLVLVLGFILTPFGADPSGRYFIPLAVPLALFAAELVLALRRKIGRWAWSLAVLVLVYNFWGTLQCAGRYPPGLTTQFNPITQVNPDSGEELIAFLREQGETRGYTNYWVAYPLAFLSGEELIFIPRLPYHQDFRYTPRDDRYAPYREMVAQAGHTAFITTRHPELDDLLRREFSRSGVTWRERQIGEYRVFFALSKKVTKLDSTSLFGIRERVSTKP